MEESSAPRLHRYSHGDEEKGLALRARQQTELAALGIDALRSGDLDAFLRQAMERARRTLHADLCALFELSREGSTLRLRAGFGWKPGLVGTLTVPTGHRSLAGYTLRVGQAVVCEDLDAEMRFEIPAAVRQHGVRSAISVIVHGPGRPFGVLSAFVRTRMRFASADVSFLQATANGLATAIVRHAAGEQLRRSEERNRQVIELAQDIIWIYEGGRIVFANPAAAVLLGAESAHDLAGRSLDSLVHPDDIWLIEGQARSVVEKGQTTPASEVRLLGAGGRQLVVELRAGPTMHDGRPAVLLVGRDVTERRAAEDALRQSEQRFRDMAEVASDWLWELGPDLRVTYISERVADLDGGPASRFIGKNPADPSFSRFDPALARVLATGQPFRDLPLAMSAPDGSVRHYKVSGKPVFDSAGRFNGYRGATSDVTQAVEAAERLRQAQKMEAIGQLTGGIAHDFNNLLAVIIGNAQLLIDRVDPAETLLYDGLKQIEIAGLRGAALARRLLAFSRRQTLSPSIVDVTQLVRSLEPLLRRTLGENIEIITHLAAEPCTTLADPSQIENSLLNLVVNARDAMPKGGRVTISTGLTKLKDGEAAGTRKGRDGSYVQLVVSDTGTGMSPDILERVFEPFFTTKESGKGTGLGLSTVYGFVKQSGGHIRIDSTVGQGTSVYIHLPQIDGDDQADEPSGRSIPVGAGQAILLVEDDPQVRDTMHNMLIDLGYRVVEASDAHSALALIKDGAAIDMLLTDVVLPGGLDGWDLARRVWRHDPDLPVLFMTGYNDNAILHRAELDDQVRVLRKPFRLKDLAAALHQCWSETQRARGAGAAAGSEPAERSSLSH